MEKELFEKILLSKTYQELNDEERKEISSWITNEKEYQEMREALQIALHAKDFRHKAPVDLLARIEKKLPEKKRNYKTVYYAAAAIIIVLCTMLIVLKDQHEEREEKIATQEAPKIEERIIPADTSDRPKIAHSERKSTPAVITPVIETSASLEANKELLEISVELF